VNFLAVHPEELSADGEIRLQGARALRAARVHRLGTGADCSFLVLGAGRGRARVLESSADILRLQVLERIPALPISSIELLVAVPRPQTIKKVLQLLPCFAVARLYFVGSERSQKSYLSSHSLHAEEIQEEILLGMEQSGQSIGPEVLQHKNLREALPQLFGPAANSQARVRAVAHTGLGACSLAAACSAQPGATLVLAVGPEAGWSESELTLFVQHGFVQVSLGPRILRVEVALAALLGQAAGF
jgi:16S rRNA (uracil1498-N3)-methyltransferase